MVTCGDGYADCVIQLESSVFLDIVNQKINGRIAWGQGLLRVSGEKPEFAMNLRLVV